MRKNTVEEKSKCFALKIIKLVQDLESRNQYILAKQILRSGTSIGANIAESVYAASKADFVNKLSKAQKEANETKYWLELLYGSNLTTVNTYEELMKDVMNIIRLLAKSIITASDNK